MKNVTKQKMRKGASVVGPFQVMGGANAAHVLSLAGYDFIVVDMEHGLIDLETAAAMFASMGECTPFVRVACGDSAIIKRALDAGAQGVMVPMLRSADQVRQAVEYCKYPPLGSRGAGPGLSSGFAVNFADYIGAANDEIMTIIQIENGDALNAIDEILDVPGVDVALVGPVDLSMSLGIDKTHPRMEEALERVLSACKNKGVAAGIFCFGEEEAARRLKQGFSFVCVGLDSTFLYGAAKAAREYISRNAGV